MDWKFFSVISALFAGLTAVLAKIGIKDLPVGIATFIRTVVILVFLGFIVILRREWSNSIQLNRQSLIFLILSGITTGLSWICYFRALQTGPVALVSALDKFSLIFAIIFSILFLHERLNFTGWIGVSFITAGTFLIVFK